jgi:hypothetical protein
MKKIYSITACLFLVTWVFAQAPNKMSYQAVVRNSSNALISNQAVGMRISILQGTANGTAIYVETHSPTTNANGLASIEIGSGTVVSGNFSTIAWANGPYFVKTETDPNGATSYSITGTSQLLSVPYALSASALTLTSPNGTIWGLSVNNQGIISTQNLNCIPVSNVGFSIPASVNAGASFIPTGLNPTGTPPYTYFWEVVPPDPNVTFSNPNIIDPEISFAQTIPPGTSKNIKVTVGNCLGANSLSQTQTTTLLAPPCPAGLDIDTTMNIVSNCNIPGIGVSVSAYSNTLVFQLGNSQINSLCPGSNGYLYFNANVNCSNNTITIPPSTPYYYCGGSNTITIQGSGTFNATMTLINLSYTLTINGTPYNCTATIQP